jgi:eukaryotic-like serine/threonine-protein kinase
MKDSITRLEAIFNTAKELPTSEQREVYLRDACRDAPDLRSQVEALLRASQQSLDAFRTKSSHGEETIFAQGDIAESPGSSIGRYKLLQKIGEGGMGVVFMAEQTEPVRRKVALKIIKLGMDTKSVVARFEAERQALALMDHPNIAKVLDAGSTETGRPYFVMELVKGVPISTYCDKNHLGAKERLELFAQVCKSIQHAHQKGVIHRDIKPGNILVTLHDGKPVPKVIDFGIAKATNQRLTEKTLFTNFAQMIGTPAYMSPEQAEMSGLDVDTRTDVYSLGVLLYELLTGTTPFPEKELLSKGYGEMQRIIAEQEPDRPSLRMSTLIGGQQTFVTKNRAGDLPLLTKQLRGDLDWIVMKALEKDRTRRHETANGMAEDVHRHLNNEPVEAAAPSLLYPFRKFYRRHRKAVLAAVLVMGGFYLAGAFAAYQAVRAKNAEQQANLARDAEVRVSKLHQEERNRAVIAEAEARQGELEAQKLAESRRLQAYIGDIMSAKVAIDGNDYPLARQRLLAQRPGEGESDLRGFEWRFLWEWCRDRSVASTITDAVGYKGKLAISPNSRWAATANKSDIQIWSLPDLRSVATVKIDTEYVSRLKFSPNSAYLLAEGDTEIVRYSGTNDRTNAISLTKVLIVDTDTWKETSSIPDGTFPFVFLNENELLVSQNHYFDPGSEIPSEQSKTAASGGGHARKSCIR